MIIKRLIYTCITLCGLIVFPFVFADETQTLLESKLSGNVVSLKHTVKTEDVIASGQLGGPLFPTLPGNTVLNSKTTHSSPKQSTASLLEQNLAFARAMNSWNAHDYDLAVDQMSEYVAQYPDGLWTGEAILHQGCEARFNGRYNEADALFNQVISLYGKSDFVGAKLVADKARSRQAVLEVMRNDPQSALGLFTKLAKTAPDWRLRTYASHWIRNLSSYRQQGVALADCGTQALAKVLHQSNRPDAAKTVLANKPDTMAGFSLSQLKQMAKAVDLPVTAVALENTEQLSAIPLPAIAQVKSAQNNHYWLIESFEDNQISLYDAQAKRRFHQSSDEFSALWQGKLLVFSDESPIGRTLDDEEAASIFGACCGVQRPESGLGSGEDVLGVPGGDNSEAECSGDPCAKGEPVWQVNPLTMNFYMSDIPLWYQPAFGPSVNIRLVYNSLSAISYRTDVGNKWQLNYGSYLVVDPGSGVTVFMPSGRRDVFMENGSGGFDSPSNSNLVLNQLNAIRYQLKWRDGAIWDYTSPAGTGQIYLTKITDKFGHRLAIQYNGDRITRILDAQNKATVFTYNAADKITQVKGPYNRTANMTYNSAGDLLSIRDMGGYTTSFLYDADKYVKRITTGQGVWNIKTEPADGDNSIGFNHYPPPDGAMWENFRITITNPDGRKQEHYWDGYSGIGWYVSPDHYVPYVSASNNVYANDVPRVEFNDGIVNGEPRLVSVRFPDAGLTNYSYDTLGRLEEIKPPNNLDEHYIWDANNNLTNVQLSTDKSTAYTYNSFGDITQIRNDFNTVNITYNATRNPVRVNDTRFGLSTFNYNSRGQLTQANYPGGERYVYIYNADFRLSQINLNGSMLSRYSYDTKKRISHITDSAFNSYLISYDNLDRQTTLTYPDGKTEDFSYGNAPDIVTQIIDRANHRWQYSYDNSRRLTHLLKPSGQALSYSYLANGDVNLTNERSKTIGFGFNDDGQLDRITDPKNKSETRDYQYGNLDEIFDPRGEEVDNSFSYSTGLLSQIYYSSSSSDGVPSVSSSSFTRDEWGRIIEIRDDLGTTKLTYDGRSRIKTIDGPLLDDTITYNYDSQSRVTNYTVQKGQVVRFTYDDHNRLSTLKRGTQNSYQLTYRDPVGELTRLSYPNNSKRDYSYDELGRIDLVNNRNASNSVLSSLKYRFNANDQIDQLTITGLPKAGLPTQTKTMLYDDADQLTKLDSQTIIHDASGNPTNAVLPNGRRYTAKYDAANRLAEQRWRSGSQDYAILYFYGWHNLIGRIEYYSAPDLGTYLHSSERVRVIHFVRELDSLDVVQRRDQNNDVTDNLVWLPEYVKTHDRLVELYTGTNSTGSQFQFHDGRGNIVTRTNFTNTTLGEYRYDPYGNIVGQSGSSPYTEYGYQSKFKSPWTNWIDFGYRFYDANVGRWINRDPLRYAAGTNRYSYNYGDPVNYFDPDGRTPLHIAVGIGIFFADIYFTSNQPYQNGEVQTVASPALGIAIGAKSLARFGAKFCASKGLRKIDPNKVHHVFGQAKHNLDGVVKTFGTPEKAFGALQDATQAVVKNQGIKGVFETTVKVGGETVTVRGNVVDGVVKIGTAFK